MNIHSYERRRISKMRRSDSISDTEILEMSLFIKTMGDPTRLRILFELMNGSLCVMHISERLKMSQSATTSLSSSTRTSTNLNTSTNLTNLSNSTNTINRNKSFC